MKSVEQAVGGRDYARLRIGIQPADPERRIGDLADFVLSPMPATERAEILTLLPRFTSAVECWLHDGIEAAMNQFNREPA